MPLAVNLARHPEGAITPDDFEIVEVPRPEVPEGWFLIRNRVFPWMPDFGSGCRRALAIIT